MIDLLRIETNERIDLEDFEFATRDVLEGIQTDPFAQFATDPAGDRSYILDGFKPTAVGDVVTVALGRAILAYREAGEVRYGALTVLGDASKGIDVSGWSDATYGIYIAFVYVDGEPASRVFWNPDSSEEFAQTVSTRKLARWSLRVEASPPGAEWLKIGEVTVVAGSISGSPADQRPLFFEGVPDDTYESAWSTEGGGAATDRNADRSTYGVKDLQTFTRAMRQCLEDLKGRGLRRWWSAGIGGMNLGFDTDPVEGKLALVDANFYLQGHATVPQIGFDASGDKLQYDRTANEFQFAIGGASVALLNGSELRLVSGLAVGGLGFNPPASTFCVEDVNFGMFNGGTQPQLFFDSGDRFWYDRASDEFRWTVNSVTQLALTGSATQSGLLFDPGTGDDSLVYDRSADTLSVQIGGAFVAGWAGAGYVVGDSDYAFTLSGTIASIFFDASAVDLLAYDRSTNQLTFQIAGTDELLAGADGLRVRTGLYVGSAGTAPFDDDIRVDGGINCGGSTNPTTGQGIFTYGINVGFDATAVDDRVAVGDANLYLDLVGTVATLQVDSTDSLKYDRSANTWTWTIGGNEELILTASILAPYATDDIALGDLTHIFTEAWAGKFIARSTAPLVEITDTNAGTDQKTFRIQNDSGTDRLKLTGINDAGSLEHDWLSFQRKTLGGAVDHELDYAILGGSLLPDTTQAYNLGSATGSIWNYFHGVGFRGRLSPSVAAAGATDYFTYTGVINETSGGGACTVAAITGGSGGTNDGWVKVFVDGDAKWIPYWDNAVM